MTRYGSLGGVIGGHERDETDEFENAVDRAMGKRLRSGDRDLGRRLWGSLANVTWTHENGDIAEYTFRAAGDLIAAIIGEGDYLDWYCESESGVVDEEVARLMAEQGWGWKTMTEPGYRDSARPPKVYCKDCVFYKNRDLSKTVGMVVGYDLDRMAVVRRDNNPLHICTRDGNAVEHPVRGLELIHVDASEKNKNMDCPDYLPFPPDYEHLPETLRKKPLDPFFWSLVSMLVFLIAYCLLEAFL